MSEFIDFKRVKVNKNNEELRKLVRRDIDQALNEYESYYTLCSEAYLEFHGINAKQFISGDSYYYVDTVDEKGATVQKKIYDRPVKLRVAYSAVVAGLAQVNRGSPDFLVETNDYALKDIADTVGNLIESEWQRSKMQQQVDMAWWNAFLFGEMIFRTYYDEEVAVKHDADGKEYEENVYRGMRARMVNSFEFLPSPEWKNDIQECPWVGFRTFKTPEEILKLYPNDFKNIEEVMACMSDASGISEYKVLDPYSLIRKIYDVKLDPETRDLMQGMLHDMGTHLGGEDKETLIEVNEYFRKDIDARVVMVGYNKIVEADYMEECHYPVVAHKSNLDVLTARGIGDVMQALPLTKTADDLFDLKMKNLALQLSSILIYNNSYFQQTPSFSPGVAMGVDLKPGDSLDNTMMQVSKYGQNFEITAEQKNFESKIFLMMGLNDFLVGVAASSNSTAKEAMIRNSASAANLDYKLRRVEQDVFTEIAQQWVLGIGKYYDADFVFTLSDGADTKFYLYLGDVEVKEKDDYVLYKYKGKKFWEPKIGKSIVEQALNSFQTEGDTLGNALETELDLAMASVPGTGEVPPVLEPEESMEGVPENVDGRWSDFVTRLSELTDGRITGVVTRADLNLLSFKFRIRASDGINMNRTLKKQELMQLIPFVAQLNQPEMTVGIVKTLLKLFNEIPQDVLGTQPVVAGAVTEAQPTEGSGPTTSADAKLNIDNLMRQAGGANSNMGDVRSIPGATTPNPTGY